MYMMFGDIENIDRWLSENRGMILCVFEYLFERICKVKFDGKYSRF